MIHLIECGRASCSHILTNDEQVWLPPDENRRTATCPKCGGDSFYTLNEIGQRIGFSQRDKYRNGIDPASILPSPRMGPKRKKALLRVKNQFTQP